MKIDYYPDTDTLYIGLSSKKSAESEDVAPGLVLDFGQNQQVVGIEIEHASKMVDLKRLEMGLSLKKKLKVQ